MGTGLRYLKWYVFPFFLVSVLCFATLVSALVTRKRIHTGPEEEEVKPGVSFLVLFIVCARVACNGQRCVETGGPRHIRLHRWGCKLACLPLFADLCARITPPQASGHLKRAFVKSAPLFPPRFVTQVTSTWIPVTRRKKNELLVFYS